MATVESPIRVVIVDDHATFGRGLEVLLNTAPGRPVEVKEVVDRPDRAADAVVRHAAQVALVDIQMPPPGGLGAIAAIHARRPECAVLVLSGVEDPATGVAALAAGATGYLVKSAEPEHLVPAIQAAHNAMTVLPSWLRDHLVAADTASAIALPQLDDEAVRVLRLLAAGASTSDVADQIHVSERTAKRVIAALIDRLGVGTRIEAAVLAAHAGLLDPPR